MGTAETPKTKIPVKFLLKNGLQIPVKFLLKNGLQIDPLWNQIAQSASITVSLAILLQRALDALILWTTGGFILVGSVVISEVFRNHAYLPSTVDYELLI